MAAITGNGYKIETDLDQYLATPIGTPDFQDICAISVDESFNETLDTYSKLCSEVPITSSKVTLNPSSFSLSKESRTAWCSIFVVMMWFPLFLFFLA